jgi:hypothetical protein
MISAFVAAAWYLGLLALMVGAAFLGRPRREPASNDPNLTYEQARFSDRNRQAARLREEELAEMRRRQGPTTGLHA